MMKVGQVQMFQGLALYDRDRPNIVLSKKLKDRLILVVKQQVHLPHLLITKEYVVDDDTHISRTYKNTYSSLFYIQWYNCWSIIHDVVVYLNALYQIIFWLCSCHACCWRWWDITRTFHLPSCELGFTPFDFTKLTGICLIKHI